jgi:antitoxin HicB
MTSTLKPHLGQDFDEFLAEEGLAAEVEARAIKKVLVALLQSADLSQVELARRMQTSRTQVRRLMDPENTSITLTTLQRAAAIVEHRLVIGFEARRLVKRPAKKSASREPVLRHG